MTFGTEILCLKPWTSKEESANIKIITDILWNRIKNLLKCGINITRNEGL